MIAVAEQAAHEGLVGYQITGRINRLREELFPAVEQVIEVEEDVVEEQKTLLERLAKATSHAQVDELVAEAGVTLPAEATKVDEKKAALAAAVEAAPIEEPPAETPPSTEGQ